MTRPRRAAALLVLVDVAQQLGAEHRRKGQETKPEIRIATARVMANSRNSRPATSPMNSSGISTAISEKVSEMMVKPICFEP